MRKRNTFTSDAAIDDIIESVASSSTAVETMEENLLSEEQSSVPSIDTEVNDIMDTIADGGTTTSSNLVDNAQAMAASSEHKWKPNDHLFDARRYIDFKAIINCKQVNERIFTTGDGKWLCRDENGFVTKKTCIGTWKGWSSYMKHLMREHKDDGYADRFNIDWNSARYKDIVACRSSKK